MIIPIVPPYAQKSPANPGFRLFAFSLALTILIQDIDRLIQGKHDIL
jgi:hypothetical protein